MTRSRRPAPASARSADAVQAHLALSHGSVSWHALPVPVRERVLALWIELLQHHDEQASTRESTP